MRQRPTVHDLTFLERLALFEVPAKDFYPMARGYYSGLMTGLNIAKVFVDLKAISLTGDVWGVLKGEVSPTPSIEEFIRDVAYGTFDRVILPEEVFCNRNLRYGRTEKLYSTGLADGTMVGLLEVPRALMSGLGDRWQTEAQFWLVENIAEVDRLLGTVS